MSCHLSPTQIKTAPTFPPADYGKENGGQKRQINPEQPNHFVDISQDVQKDNRGASYISL